MNLFLSINIFKQLLESFAVVKQNCSSRGVDARLKEHRRRVHNAVSCHRVSPRLALSYLTFSIF